MLYFINSDGVPAMFSWFSSVSLLLNLSSLFTHCLIWVMLLVRFWVFPTSNKWWLR